MADPLNGVRPGGRRSFWLREALADEAPQLAADIAAPPLAGRTRVDVAIVGGGFTGLWTALRLRELQPDARIVILERDICGGGPSGRNGGFVTGWWDELPALIRRFGTAAAVRTAQALDAAIASLGPWCEANGVDAQWQQTGFLSVSAAPAQDGTWSEAVEACAAAGCADRWKELAADEVQSHAHSPVFRGGAWMPVAGTVQPARLARGLRRVALGRGIEIHEGTSAVLPARPPVGVRPVEITTTSRAGSGVVEADHVVVAMNAWAASWPPLARRLVTWSSYIVLTEPIPDRLQEIGWTAGEGIADSRFTLHYARTTPDGRIALGGGGGLRRWFPSLSDVRIDDAWGGPIDITDDHRPWFGTLPGGRIHHGVGYSGNGVAPSILGGRILAALVAGPGADDDAATLPIVGDAARPRAVPPEPLRGVGARIFREAMVRREMAEEAGRQPPRVAAAISRIPRRLGYHLGPEGAPRDARRLSCPR